ncbi:SIR2 family protein [Cohaesibacter gelatinilyticus]|uniref:SIR2-like domain-containing protein n=1 Tax=Cohaesibacter gelatinilyticus TaxID=372072 RepID=A0A285PCZ3_9HYPH|nr:SIR2 family protein [Cohaesibacter gelatinilyticus]SNZ19620.1 SIR2-like domain-containing protein [Cohaesibacter gelatinilyticus]
MIKFQKGTRNEFDRLQEADGFEERAEIIRRQLAEVFGSKNLSFLLGSGCSSFKSDGQELGIPTMGPLAQEFRGLFDAKEREPLLANDFVTAEQKDRLHNELGIDLLHEDYQWNLERMMEALMTTHQFCISSNKENFKEAVDTVEEVISGVKKFILQKCTQGQFAQGDDSVVSLYRRFYQSLATRSRGLASPWVFTTNYDLFNERAMDRSGIPYANGFSGTVERRFNPATYRRALAEQLDISSKRWAAVEGYVYFCKLHGSVNWTEEATGLYPIREATDLPNPAEDRVMIYPTPSKQTASFGSPYADMFREFQRQIVQDQSVLLVAGFSFGDEHVNNIIFQGLTLPGFRLIAFLDPDTNDITKQLASLGDPRIWFIWGEDETTGKKAHYFDNIVKYLMPSSADQKADQAIEKILEKLLAKPQGENNDEG